MSNTYKLRVKIGQAEFEAEGPEETVKNQFDQFAEIVGKAPAPTPKNGSGGDGVPVLAMNDPEITTEQIHRVFRTDGDNLSLRLLPKTSSVNADALLMIIYGYSHIKGEHEVSAADLIRSARQSGFIVQRVDKALQAYDQYINAGGQKKGKRYGLNNPGLTKARELIKGMTA